MREPFLFYEEKIQTTQEEKHQKAIRRARKASTASDSNTHTSYDPPIRRQDRPSKPDGLTKQTYSCKRLMLFPVGARFSPRYSDSDCVLSLSLYFNTSFQLLTAIGCA